MDTSVPSPLTAAAKITAFITVLFMIGIPTAILCPFVGRYWIFGDFFGEPGIVIYFAFAGLITCALSLIGLFFCNPFCTFVLRSNMTMLRLVNKNDQTLAEYTEKGFPSYL